MLGISTGSLVRNCMDLTAKLIPFISPPRSNYTDLYIDDIRVRMYEAPRMHKKKDGELFGAVIFFHGGGWTAGSIGKFPVDLE